jgi:starch-binding outer membrane protein, SusD/RagB family
MGSRLLNQGWTMARGSVLAAIGAGVIVAGCEFNPLAQEAPSRIEADDLTNPSNAALLVRSAVSEFECALAQHVFGTGLVSDELRDGSLSEAYWDFDRRTLSASRAQYASGGCGGGTPGNYMALSSARYLADYALDLLDGWTDDQVPNRSELIAQAAAFSGYSLVLLGESMCSAAIDIGPELSRSELFQLASSRFDRALAAGAVDQTAHLSHAGRARANLNLGNFGQAEADAAAVPAGFERAASYSDASTRRQNRLFTALYRSPVATVDSSFLNLTVNGTPDTRVNVIDTGGSAGDADVPLLQPAKYSQVSSPIRIASWEEAQLIQAEARLDAGDEEGAVAAINRLRDQAGLPAYAGGTATEIRAQIIEERRRELFLEGHRLGDMIRYGLPLSPEPGTSFRRGGLFGDQLCFPLPDVERNNNPNI